MERENLLLESLFSGVAGRIVLAVAARGGETCRFVGEGCSERRKSAIRSASRLRSAGPSTPSASRSAGESWRKVGVETRAAAKRVLKRDKPAWRSQAATCASAMTAGGAMGRGRERGNDGEAEKGVRCTGRGRAGQGEPALHVPSRRW